jgi:hypothetical protein
VIGELAACLPQAQDITIQFDGIEVFLDRTRIAAPGGTATGSPPGTGTAHGNDALIFL